MKPYVFILLFVCYVGHAQYDDIYDWRGDDVIIVNNIDVIGYADTDAGWVTWGDTQLYSIRDDRPIVVLLPVVRENLYDLLRELDDMENLARDGLIR